MLYKWAVRKALENQPNLTLFQQEVEDLIVEGGAVRGIVTRLGLTFHAPAVVLTTGTFLGGRIHVVIATHQAGRAGDPPSNAPATLFRRHTTRVRRLKPVQQPHHDGRSPNWAIRISIAWSRKRDCKSEPVYIV